MKNSPRMFAVALCNLHSLMYDHFGEEEFYEQVERVRMARERADNAAIHSLEKELKAEFGDNDLLIEALDYAQMYVSRRFKKFTSLEVKFFHSQLSRNWLKIQETYKPAWDMDNSHPPGFTFSAEERIAE